jgi:hypothetical protein
LGYPPVRDKNSSVCTELFWLVLLTRFLVSARRSV